MQICWLNENLIHVISPVDKVEEKGIEKLQDYYIGYRSPLLTMYLNGHDQIRLEWENVNFQYQKGEVNVDKRQFVQSSINVLSKANAFLSFVDNSRIQSIQEEFSKKLANHREELSEYLS